MIGGAGGRQRSVAGRIVAKQEFAGYWEYVLDEAIFTAPAHPHWGGTGVIGPAGDLLGIGSLQLQHAGEQGRPALLNMVVPIDLLKPILDDLLTLGRAEPAAAALARPVRDRDGGSRRGGRARRRRARREGGAPGRRRRARRARREGAQPRRLLPPGLGAWDSAGVEAPLTIGREGRMLEIAVATGDRARFLKGPLLH